MVRNIPFFRGIDNSVIELIVYLLRPRFYDKGSLIVKQGDEVSEIFLLRSGSVVVEIPDPRHPDKNLYLDWLNEGSCFCVHSAFNQDMVQHVNFRASTGCIINTLQVKSLRKLEKENLQINDCLSKLEIQIKNGSKTHLDFFRYQPPRGKEFNERIRRMLRLKFRAFIIYLVQKKRRNQLRKLPALEAVREHFLKFEQRRQRLEEIKGKAL